MEVFTKLCGDSEVIVCIGLQSHQNLLCLNKGLSRKTDVGHFYSDDNSTMIEIYV